MSPAVEMLVALCEELAERADCPERGQLRARCWSVRNEDPLATKFNQAVARFRVREANRDVLRG